MVKLKETVIEIVDENGEYRKGAFIENYEGGVFYSKEAQEKMKQYQADKKDYTNFTDIAGGFSFILVETLIAFHKDSRFNDMEKARIMFLGTYCSYESSGRYLMTNNNRYLLKSHLQNLLEISNKKEFYKFYNKLVETGIIEEEVLGRFEIKLRWNSDYHFKGKTTKSNLKSTDVIKGYDKQIQSLYKGKDSNGKSINTPKNLYVMFMVLPFINTESNVLCNNPLKKHEEDAEPLQLNDLADMFGYAKPHMIKSRLLHCKLFDTNVFFIGEGSHKGKNYTRIYVNPYVFNRSSKAPNASLQAMFPLTANTIIQRKKNTNSNI